MLLVALAACRSHPGGHLGARMGFALESPGPLSPVVREPGPGPEALGRPGAEVLEGTQEVRVQAWVAAHGLKRKGAWLTLGLRVEGERVRLLSVRGHEGSGAEARAEPAERFRGLVEWALYRYVRGQRGEVVLTLRRGEGMWREEVESTGPVLSATLPQAPYEAFPAPAPGGVEDPGPLRGGARRGPGGAQEDGAVAASCNRTRRWRSPPRPLEKYVLLLEEERQREVRWRAVQRKLAEYEDWGRHLLATYVPPPRRLAPGYLLSESPLREQSLRALGSATLAWAYAHTEDPDFLKRTPDEVALYLLASRSALASVVQQGRLAAVHLDYNEAFDPEVYKPEELVLELLVGLTPVAGEVADAKAAVTGRSLTGHHLTHPERVVCALGVLVPFVAGAVLIRGGDEGAEQLALLTGRSLDEVRVLSRVASHLSPGDAKEIERLMAAASRGHTFSEEELRFLQRVARGLEAPLHEAAGALKAGQKVPLLGARMLADGSRLLPGTPMHKAQRWVDYQFRHPEKYRRFSFQPDAGWERLYESILKNRQAGNAFEDAILQTGRYERNGAMMMPPPGSRAQGFIPDSVKGNPAELVWGQPYSFVEAKARKELSLSGNLEAMIAYVETYGGHIELWVRSANHADGATRLSKPLLNRLMNLNDNGKAILKYYP